MVCKKCGAAYEGSFCPECGEPADEALNVCPVCGKEREEGKRFCVKCGYDFSRSQPSEASQEKPAAAAKEKKQPLAFLKKLSKKTWIIILSVALAIVIALAVAIPVAIVSSNIFRIGKVDKINIGDSRERVKEVLGEPYVFSDSLYEYYDDDFKALMKKMEDAEGDLEGSFEDMEDEDDLENVFGDLEDLLLEYETTEYQYIAVSFDGTGAVASVYFDAKRTEATKDSPKTYQKHKLVTKEVLRYVPTDIVYSVEFTDGSFYKAIALHNFTATGTDNKVQIEWKDAWKSDYSAQLSVTENPDILAGNCGDGVFYYLDTKGDNVLRITGCGKAELEYNLPNSVIEKHPASVFIGKEVTLGDWHNLPATSGGVAVEEGNPAYTAKDGCLLDISGAVLILATSDGHIPDGVTVIGSNSFALCTSVTELTVPEGVTEIQENAFSSLTQLESIILPSTVTECEEYAFFPNAPVTYFEGPFAAINRFYISVAPNVETLVINGGIMNLQSYTTYLSGFKNVKTLIIEEPTDCRSYGMSFIRNDIIFDLPALTTLEWYADSLPQGCSFENCPDLNTVILSDNTLGVCKEAFLQTAFRENASNWDGGVLYAGKHLLYADSALSGSYSVKEGTLSISAEAFADCTELTSVSVPDSVIFIGEDAFPDQILETQESVYLGKHLLSADKTAEQFTIADGTLSIGSSAFRNNTNLKSIVIPEGVTSIGNTAFYGCSLLETIVLPDSLISIGDHAFDGCSVLKSIVLPENVTSIGEYAFYNCSALTSVTFGSKIRTIYNGAFNNCTNLKTVQISDLAAWCNIEFGMENSNPLTLDGANLYVGNQVITELVIPEGVTSIGDYAFFGTNFRSVTIPDSVASIGYAAFSGSAIERLVLNAALIDYSAFSNCTSLTSVTFKDGVHYISGSAFEDCTALSSVTFGNGLLSVGDEAFRHTAVKNITLPASLRSIESTAFYSCESLTDVVFSLTDGWGHDLSDPAKNLEYVTRSPIDYTLILTRG